LKKKLELQNQVQELILENGQLKIQVRELMLESSLRHIEEAANIILDQGYDNKTDRVTT